MALTQHPTYDPAESVVRVRGLCRGLTPDGGILAGLDLDLRAGEVVGLMGPRGSGKSTLLRALARTDREVMASGSLRTPESVTVLDVEPRLLPWKRLLDNVVAGLEAPDALLRGRRALAEVGLLDQEQAWPTDLDRGEQQRVALARALAAEPELILADEPYRDLDALTQRGLHRALRASAARRGLAVLFVTNDPHEAIVLADRVLTLAEGRLRSDLVVRGADGEPPVEEAYGALHARLLSELGIGAPARPVVAPRPAAVRRRETA